MKKTVLFLSLLFALPALPQQLSPFINVQLLHTGTPVGDSTILCTSTTMQGVLIINIETTPTGSRLWTCDNSTGTWGWHQLATSILATTASIGGSVLLSGVCTSAQTVSVPGSVVGKNVSLTPSDGSLQQGGTVAQGSVSPAGTVNYQLCATGLASVTTAAKTYTVQVLP